MAVSIDENDEDCMSSDTNQLLTLAIQGGEELTAYMAPGRLIYRIYIYLYTLYREFSPSC